MADQLLVAYARLPEHPAKLRLLRFLGRGLNPAPVLRQPDGALLRVQLDDFIGWSMIKHGYYEPESLALARRLLAGKGGVFVDVGANIGLFTVSLGAVAGTTVVAIEPDCANCARLRDNVALNRLANVHIFNGGCASVAAIAAISTRASHNAGSAFTSASPERGDVGPARDWVPLLELERVLQAIVPARTRPELMKLDIEGAEKDALSGLDWDGPYRPRNILFEYNALSAEAWGSLAGMKDFFESRDYALRQVDGTPFGDAATIEDNVWAVDASAAA